MIGMQSHLALHRTLTDCRVAVGREHGAGDGVVNGAIMFDFEAAGGRGHCLLGMKSLRRRLIHKMAEAVFEAQVLSAVIDEPVELSFRILPQVCWRGIFDGRCSAMR